MKRPGFLPVRGDTRRPGNVLLKTLPVALPVVLAVTMAVALRNPAMLMFGLMGPLLVLLGRWGRKKDQAEQAAQQEADERERQRHQQLDQQQKTQAWLSEQEHAHPAVTDWLHNPLWRAEAHTHEVSVRIGRGIVTPPAVLGIHGPVSGVPLTIPLHSTLAVVGSGLDAVAAWRAVACQAMAIASARHPVSGSQLSVAAVWEKNQDIPRRLTIPHPDGEQTYSWCFVDSDTQVPPQSHWVLVVAGNQTARLYHRGVVTHDGIQPDAVTFAESRWVRARLVDVDSGPGVDQRVVDSSDRGSLWGDICAGQPGIDLVTQGPHTLVWGKTGSGKSVLVQRLVGSLCARYSPDQLALVGIDFKGGATLAPLTSYPHNAGLLTDLAPAATGRVTAALRAEITRREQLFADHRVAIWQDLPGDISCPRVLIVVDEAGVVAQDAPDLMAVLSDIAGRGRSLGLHLLIATQRPQHLPRNIIANCSLRLCLGVTDADEASQYAPDIPRHLLQSLRHSPPGTVTVPNQAGTYTLATVDTSHPEVSWPGDTQHALWCDELPEHITSQEIAETATLTGDGYVVGFADYPERQTQQAWVYRPGADGPLVVVGESGSGHTTCLTHVATEADRLGVEAVRASGVASVLVSQLMGLGDSPHPTRPTLLLIDRLDRTLQGVPPEGQAWILDAVDTVARQLSERGDGSGAIITSTPGTSVATALSRWNATVCLLRHRDGTSWALAGAPPALHSPTAPPGRAVVGGVAMQWCYPEDDTDRAWQEVNVARAPEGVLVITPRHHDRPGISVVSPAEAEIRWQEVKNATGQGVGVVCSDIPPQQMRQWCGPGHSTPPVVAAWPYGWLLHPGGVRLVTLEGVDS